MISKDLSYDSFTGIKTIHHYDEMTGKTHLEYVQDVEGLVDKNKALHNTEHQKIGIKNSWMHAATIPDIVQLQWKKKYNIDIYSEEDWPRIRKLLNSPDYRYLKTGNCKI